MYITTYVYSTRVNPTRELCIPVTRTKGSKRGQKGGQKPSRHIGTLAHWQSGVLAVWRIGTLAHWQSGTLAQNLKQKPKTKTKTKPKTK